MAKRRKPAKHHDEAEPEDDLEEHEDAPEEEHEEEEHEEEEKPPKQPPEAPQPQPAKPAQPAALNADQDEAYKQMQAEARAQAARLAKTIGSPPAEPKRPHEMREGDEELVACTVPKTFQLTLNDGITKVSFLEGVRQIPKSLLEHWYVKANGVVPQPE